MIFSFIILKKLQENMIEVVNSTPTLCLVIMSIIKQLNLIGLRHNVFDSFLWSMMALSKWKKINPILLIFVLHPGVQCRRPEARLLSWTRQSTRALKERATENVIKIEFQSSNFKHFSRGISSEKIQSRSKVKWLFLLIFRH